MDGVCCIGLQPVHWVPDSHALCCSSCGVGFTIVVRRHHCRCCGAVFCDTCSNKRTVLPGWGYEKLVRVCDECYELEATHMPMLLAGHVFVKPGGDSWSRQRRYLRLSHDQTVLTWSPWHEGEESHEADESQHERRALASQLTCVTVSGEGSRSTIVIQIGETERISFEGRAENIAAWKGALCRLIAVIKQRKSYETLYGGDAGNAVFSPRTRAVNDPRVQQLLQERQDVLISTQQTKLRRRGAASGSAPAGAPAGAPAFEHDGLPPLLPPAAAPAAERSLGSVTGARASPPSTPLLQNPPPPPPRARHAQGTLLEAAPAPSPVAPILSAALEGGLAFASWATAGRNHPPSNGASNGAANGASNGASNNGHAVNGDHGAAAVPRRVMEEAAPLTGSPRERTSPPSPWSDKHRQFSGVGSQPAQPRTIPTHERTPNGLSSWH